MDATNTQQIPRAVVNALDTNEQDGDTTMVIASGLARGQAQQAQPQQVSAQQVSAQQQLPAQPRPGQQGTQQPISPALLEATPTQPTQVPAQQQNYRPAPEPEQPPAPRELEGLVPTVQQPANPRSTLSRRLEGD